MMERTVRKRRTCDSVRAQRGSNYDGLAGENTEDGLIAALSFSVVVGWLFIRHELLVLLQNGQVMRSCGGRVRQKCHILATRL